MRALPFLLAVAVAMACAPPSDRAVRLQRLAAERRRIELAFDPLAARFAASRERIRFWQEVRDRNESGLALVCASPDPRAEEGPGKAPPSSPPPYHTCLAGVALGPTLAQ